MYLNQIFTNADYAIRRENDCFAYQVVSIDDKIEAVQLKLKSVAPTKLKIDLSSCGKKKIHFPIIQTDIVETFTLTTFGKRKCIMNKDKCLIEFIYKPEHPIATCEFNFVLDSSIKILKTENSLVLLDKIATFNETPIIINNPVMFIEPTDTIEWLTCLDEAHSSVTTVLNRLNELKHEKEEELKILNTTIKNRTIESHERCKHQIKTIELATLNCKINYCTYCKIKI